MEQSTALEKRLELQVHQAAVYHGLDLEVGVGQHPLVVGLLRPQNDLPQRVPAAEGVGKGEARLLGTSPYHSTGPGGSRKEQEGDCDSAAPPQVWSLTWVEMALGLPRHRCYHPQFKSRPCKLTALALQTRGMLRLAAQPAEILQVFFSTWRAGGPAPRLAAQCPPRETRSQGATCNHNRQSPPQCDGRARGEPHLYCCGLLCMSWRSKKMLA